MHQFPTKPDKTIAYVFDVTSFEHFHNLLACERLYYLDRHAYWNSGSHQSSSLEV